MNMNTFIYAFLAIYVLLSAGCEDKKSSGLIDCTTCLDEEIIVGNYNPEPYELNLPEWMLKPPVPATNPLTKAGVNLGRHLFYDPILSSDGTISCATCHQQKNGFTDNLAVSKGVLGMEGRRSAMSLANVAYHPAGFFWDGRVSTLENQALVPVEDHVEMNESWPNVELKLKQHADYPAMFRQAFNIEKKGQITKDLVVAAIAQFERTLISARSRYDLVFNENKGWPTDAEERGRQLFFIEPFVQADNHPGCSHCHGFPHFTDFTFKNNGLDSVGALNEFKDLGRAEVSQNQFDSGKFKVPTLRNIALTAPYMHDGRFQTLEQVVDQYSTGGHGVANEDANIQKFTLTPQQKSDLIAFLHMLTDTSFVNNPEFSNPFE